MSKKQKAPVHDRAAPTIRKPKKTDVEKVSVTRTMAQAMQSSGSWGAATDVQGAVVIWNKSADDIEANAKVIAGLKDQLRTSESKQRTLRRGWQASTKQVLSTVNVFCSGSANLIKAFNFDVLTNAPLGALAAPEGLTVAAGQELGQAAAAWDRGGVRHGFVVQHATDSANAATYSAATPCTQSKYMLGGAPSGSTVYFRVAAIDPTSASGIGPWCAWAAGTVR